MKVLKTLFLTILLLNSALSFSCSCHADIEEMNMMRFNDASSIFIGTPDSIGLCQADGQAINFQIIKTYKGNAQYSITVDHIICSGSCSFNFEKGQQYLVYLYPVNNGFQIRPCSGTRKILSEAELNGTLSQAKRYNVHSYIEQEIEIWKHEIEFLENISIIKNGKPDTRYLNGQKTSEGKLNYGLPSGKWEYFYPTGNIKAIGNYENGQKTGFWIEYNTYYESFADSTTSERKRFLIKSSGRYENGLKEGKWERINLDGSIQTLYYRKGKFIGEKEN